MSELDLRVEIVLTKFLFEEGKIDERTYYKAVEKLREMHKNDPPQEQTIVCMEYSHEKGKNFKQTGQKIIDK